jgi:hypothetical protein
MGGGNSRLQTHAHQPTHTRIPLTTPSTPHGRVVQQASIGPGSSFNESKLGMAGDQTDLRAVNLGLYRVGEGAYSHPHLHFFLIRFALQCCALFFAFVVVRDADQVRALESETNHKRQRHGVQLNTYDYGARLWVRILHVHFTNAMVKCVISTHPSRWCVWCGDHGCLTAVDIWLNHVGGHHSTHRELGDRGVCYLICLSTSICKQTSI